MDVLRGTGVILRPWRPDDAPDVSAAADEIAHRYIPPLPRPYTLDDALRWITEGVPAAIAAGGWSYGVADPETDRIIGGVDLSLRPRETGEIGYWVAPWARGRGVATEAARLLADRALHPPPAPEAVETGLHRLELRTDPENVASQRVALAAGFSREGIARGGGRRDGGRYDQIVWARLATDSGEPAARTIPDLPTRRDPQGFGDLGGELADGVVSLRPLTPADADDVFALRSLPECYLRSVPPNPPGRDEVRWRCGTAGSVWLAGQRADLTVRDAETGRFAGEIGLFYAEAGIQQAMIGYSLAREWRGRGYAARAVNLLVDWAFTHLRVERVIAGTAPDNTSSQRVLARAGFLREAYERRRLPGPDGARIDNIQWVRFRPER